MPAERRLARQADQGRLAALIAGALEMHEQAVWEYFISYPWAR
jgi:hypothetical protein